jgi:SP family sugar:H+ symporter-like MFS transporter
LSDRPLTQASCVNVISTFPGLYLVEKMGRRNLLLMGAIGMSICQYVVAITGTVAGTEDQSAQRTAIAFVCIYIFFFACSWGPVAWVVTGELFPLKVRAKALSMTTATNWLLNFSIAYATPYMVNEGKGYANLQSKVFFVSSRHNPTHSGRRWHTWTQIWGSFCFVCIAFVWFLIYETKGLSLEQVDELYSVVQKATKSKDFQPQISFQNVEQAAKGGMSLQEVRQMSITGVERTDSVEGAKWLAGTLAVCGVFKRPRENSCRMPKGTYNSYAWVYMQLHLDGG